MWNYTDKVIDHFLDCVDVKLTACMGIKHSSLIDMLLLSCNRRFDCEKLGVNICHIHRRELNGELAHMAGCNTA